MRGARALGAVPLVAVALAWGAPPAAALNTVTVTTTADGGAGSLRAAFDAANSDADDTVIELQPGATYVLGCPGTNEDANLDGDLDHTADGETLAINGNGATIEQTCAGERAVHHLGDADLTVNDLTVTGGDAQGDGGGLATDSGGISVTINGSTFTGNSASGEGGGADTSGGSANTVVTASSFTDNHALDGAGGGLLSSGGSATTTISDSTFSGNTAEGADGDGGAVYAGGGGATVSITRSSLVGNTASNDGGGLVGTGGGVQFSMVASTVAGNTAGNDGGGVLSGGGDETNSLVEVTNSTITDNEASRGGGLATIRDANIRLTHVTMTDNRATVGENLANFSFGDQTDFAQLVAFATVITGGVGGDGDCSLPGPLTASGGYNVDSDGSCGFDDAADLPSTTATGLGALADNGGPTETRLPAEDSALIDAIPAAACDASVTADQRGVSRPQLEGCDVGAVEWRTTDGAPLEPPAAAAVETQPDFTG